MKSLSLALAHTRIMLLNLVRSPSFIVPTVLFATMFYAFFAMPFAKTPGDADFVMGSFVAFAMIGVSLFQFGVGIANERGRPWERYMRTLPIGSWVRLTARCASAAVIGLTAAALVAIVGRIFTPIDFTALQWLTLFGYAVLGAIPFILIGMTIGYWCSATGALPIANIIYLVLSFAGGLWMPPSQLPGFVRAISVYLPTRNYGEMLWSVGSHEQIGRSVAVLALYAVVFAALTLIGYRRDEKTRYA
jgi:ABC-2 type transport system permease protein